MQGMNNFTTKASTWIFIDSAERARFLSHMLLLRGLAFILQLTMIYLSSGIVHKEIILGLTINVIAFFISKSRYPLLGAWLIIIDTLIAIPYIIISHSSQISLYLLGPLSWYAVSTTMASLVLDSRFSLTIIFVVSAELLYLAFSIDKNYQMIIFDTGTAVVLVSLYAWFGLIIRSKMEARIIKQEKELTESSHLARLGVMAGGIAHEINNPLAIIVGKGDNLLNKIHREKKIDENELIKELEKIRENSRRITKIINYVKLISSEESFTDIHEVNLHSFTKNLEELFTKELTNYNIKFSINLEYNKTIRMDESQMQKAFVQIISNSIYAVKYLSEKQKWIRIEIRLENESYIKIEISDGGNAITSKIREKVMNPFFTTKTIGEGSGLGLSVAMNIIDRHDGHLILEQISPYTKFAVYLRRNNH